MVVVDAYTHVGVSDSSVLDGFRPVEEKDFNIDKVLENMEKAGVDKTVIIHVHNWEYTEANREIAKLIEKYPEKLIGFGRVNPNCPECAYSVAREAVKELGLKEVLLPEQRRKCNKGGM